MKVFVTSAEVSIYDEPDVRSRLIARVGPGGELEFTRRFRHNGEDWCEVRVGESTGYIQGGSRVTTVPASSESHESSKPKLALPQRERTPVSIWKRVFGSPRSTSTSRDRPGSVGRLFGKREQAERSHTGADQSSMGVGVLFDWQVIGKMGGGNRAWQVFCEACDPRNLAQNPVLITDVQSDACKIEIKTLRNSRHAFCIALPDARSEQVNYVRRAVSAKVTRFLLPEDPFVSPALVGPWGPPIGRIGFDGEFTLYDGDFLWVLLHAAEAKWNCSISEGELNRFLHAINSCRPITDNEMIIYAHAIGMDRLEQALTDFRSDCKRLLMHQSEDKRSVMLRECEEFIARLERAIT